jgi:hypothetical protein
MTKSAMEPTVVVAVARVVGIWRSVGAAVGAALSLRLHADRTVADSTRTGADQRRAARF